MAEHLTDTNVGNIEYICKQDAVDYCKALMNAEVIQNTDDWGYGKERYNQTEVILRFIENRPPADVVQVVRCKYCIHNNDCDIQYSAQAGDNFFCGFGETEKDVREDVYE